MFVITSYEILCEHLRLEVEHSRVDHEEQKKPTESRQENLVMIVWKNLCVDVVEPNYTSERGR